MILSKETFLEELFGENLDSLNEALDTSQRIKRSMVMRRNKAKIAAGRKKAMNKTPTREKKLERAEKRARKLVAQKLAKGKPQNELSAGMKSTIETKLKKMKPRIERMAKALLAKEKNTDKNE